MIKLTANTTPREITPDKTAQTNKTTDGYNVFTVTPSSDYSAEAQIISSGQVIKDIKLAAGVKVPYPFSKDFKKAIVNIKNISDNDQHSIKAGWYTLSSSPTSIIDNTKKTVNQYDSIGGQGASSPQTLRIQTISNNAMLALVFIGSNSPIPVFLNKDQADIPESWKMLKNAEFVDNTYKLSKNFYGATIFVVNVSLNSTDVFNVNLV